MCVCETERERACLLEREAHGALGGDETVEAAVGAPYREEGASAYSVGVAVDEVVRGVGAPAMHRRYACAYAIYVRTYAKARGSSLTGAGNVPPRAGAASRRPMRDEPEFLRAFAGRKEANTTDKKGQKRPTAQGTGSGAAKSGIRLGNSQDKIREEIVRRDCSICEAGPTLQKVQRCPQ